jgi:Pyruvate/2-oxoacid:ferredoxin oxidoreductase delta subunit
LEHGEKFGVERLTREQAIERIDTLRKTGHYNKAYFKVATGGRTGVICNCCAKCCGQGTVTKLTRDYAGRNRNKLEKIKCGHMDPLAYAGHEAPSGYTVKRDKEKCDLSGECAKVCPFEAVKVEDGRYKYDPVLCMGCGVCVDHCKKDALRLVFEDKGGYVPLNLDLIKNYMKKSS